MFKATKITITRAEGLASLCGRKYEFEGEECWEEANKHLFKTSGSCPRHGGYDRHDFVVEFENGETWPGTLDCKHRECENADLDVKAHIREFAQFYAGTRMPGHLSRKQYEDCIARAGELPDQMREFLENYAV